jgi:cytochrome bd-type quinol oxidase subunit 2
VPHLRDGFIIAKVGIEQSSTAFPLLFLPLSLLLFLLFLFAVAFAFLVCHSRRESASAVAFALKGRGFSPAVTATNVSGL